MNSTLKAQLKGIKHVALDMDGTIYLGATLFPFTIPFLEKLDRLGVSYSFLTNNPTRSISAYIENLRKRGIECREDQMYSTSVATVDYIKTHYPQARNLFLLGTESMIREFEDAGYRSCSADVQDEPDVVVAAFDTTLTYERLCRCAWWVAQGKPYIATNPDWVCPTDQPTILVDCGSICACIEGATGRKPDVVIGKPNPDILYGVLSKKGVRPCECAMIGDRIYTDVKTGINAGAMGVLVLSGETTMEIAGASDVVPTIICKDIEEFGNLLEEAKQHTDNQ